MIKICENEKSHEEAPKNYVEWHKWVYEKAKTHEQKKCEYCGLLVIWIKK